MAENAQRGLAGCLFQAESKRTVEVDVKAATIAGKGNNSNPTPGGGGGNNAAPRGNKGGSKKYCTFCCKTGHWTSQCRIVFSGLLHTYLPLKLFTVHSTPTQLIVEH